MWLVVPTFDPSVKELTSVQFIGRIEQLRQAYGWGDKLLLFAVSTKLQGCANLWLDSAPEVYTSWTKFVTDFLFEFPSTINTAEIHMKLMSMRRNMSETPETFYYRALAVGRQGGLADQSIIKYVLNGINDLDMKRSLSVKTYACANELLRAIQNYCMFNSYKNNVSVKHDVPNGKAVLQPLKNKDIKDNSNIVCYNCRKTGHISRNCAEPQKRAKCEKCNKYGHDAQNCKVSAISQKSKCNSIEENKEKLYMKNVEVNSIVAEALIDSGSARSLVRRKFANQLQENLKEKCFVRLKGFAGSECECFEQIKANIAIDNVCVDVKLLIVDDDKLEYNVLIGRDVLCSNGNLFVIDGEDCWMQSKINIIESVFDENHNEKLSNVLKTYDGRFNTLGKTKITKINIKLDNYNPIKMKPYRWPFAKRPILD
ncbi:uncharacterized protein LOC118755074 [Rhagoletis pomonella]|uniref:uncharacterized protein LOC118755074 n=1 Tax=Rhagoletis pomonella TaxID=28610 RepID=UPI0017813F75|nr:uncharacterized protein LOC118755074 [Rhagoletis pomonella]